MQPKTLTVGGCWPTKMQTWLLKAALLDGDEARGVWEQWSAEVDFENMDHASERLIPLLNQNLKRLGVEHPLSGRFQGLHRQSWLRGSLLAQTGSDVIKGLEDTGIETLILKGCAYSSLYYQRQALRPMADLDILVPVSQAQAALNYFLDQGWRVTTKKFVGLSNDYLCNHNGVGLRKAGMCEIDLHWHALHECLSMADDDGFWQAAKPMIAYGVQTKTLSDADHLFHCCVHGLRWNSLSPIRWVADAHIMITTANDLDWDLLLERAEQMQLALSLYKALRYLHETVNSPIPPFVLEHLDAITVSSDEIHEFQIKTQPRGPMGRLPSILCLYRRQYKANQHFLLRPFNSLNYVRRYWLAEGELTLVSAVVTKLTRLLKTG